MLLYNSQVSQKQIKTHRQKIGRVQWLESLAALSLALYQQNDGEVYNVSGFERTGSRNNLLNALRQIFRTTQDGFSQRGLRVMPTVFLYVWFRFEVKTFSKTPKYQSTLCLKNLCLLCTSWLIQRSIKAPSMTPITYFT